MTLPREVGGLTFVHFHSLRRSNSRVGVLFSSGCCGGDFLLLLTRSDVWFAESLVVGVDWLVLEMAFNEIL